MNTNSPEDAEGLVDRIYKKANLRKLIGQDVKLITRDGVIYVGPCPFCGPKEHVLPFPEHFAVNTERKFYHCFRCKKGGDVFKWIEERNGVSFIGAVRILAEIYGLSSTEEDRRPIPDKGYILKKFSDID